MQPRFRALATTGGHYFDGLGQGILKLLGLGGLLLIPGTAARRPHYGKRRTRVAFDKWKDHDGGWCGQVVVFVALCGLLLLAGLYYAFTNNLA